MIINFLNLRKQINGIDKKIFNSIKKKKNESSYIGGEDLLNFH